MKPLVNVPVAIRYLRDAFDPARAPQRTQIPPQVGLPGRGPRDFDAEAAVQLHPALANLAEAIEEIERLDHVDAQVLLVGFEVLADSVGGEPRKSRKLVLLRDNLALLLLDAEPAAILASAVVALWADIISALAYAGVRATTAKERAAWHASAQAWAEGLMQIIRRTHSHRTYGGLSRAPRLESTVP